MTELLAKLEAHRARLSAASLDSKHDRAAILALFDAVIKFVRMQSETKS